MSDLPRIFWEKTLAYQISPKSGPVRRMVTLADARTAMIEDLPQGATKLPHWLSAGMRLVAASESGTASDIRSATDALADALDVEGWLSASATAEHA